MWSEFLNELWTLSEINKLLWKTDTDGNVESVSVGKSG